jgi:hypothetical protein
MTEVERQCRFWLVCNPDRIRDQPPTCIHQTYESANGEAQRLARAFPGCTFHVLASIEFFEKSDLRYHVFNNDTQFADMAVPF